MDNVVMNINSTDIRGLYFQHTTNGDNFIDNRKVDIISSDNQKDIISAKGRKDIISTDSRRVLFSTDNRKDCLLY